jgi:hypothetical protein
MPSVLYSKAASATLSTSNIAANADLTQPSVKKAQKELETIQKRISTIRQDVSMLKDWWSTGATLRDLSRKYNVPQETLVHKCMVVGMQGLLLAEAAGMVSYTTLSYGFR